MDEVPEHVYRVISGEDWEQTKFSDVVPRGGSDARDGFVHLSTEDTVLETANLYFEASENPVLVEINTKELGKALRWEAVESRDGKVFPHLYAAGIPMAAVRGGWSCSSTHPRVSHSGSGLSFGVTTQKNRNDSKTFGER